MINQADTPLSPSIPSSSTAATSPFITLTELGLTTIRPGSSASSAAVSAEGVISINQQVSFAGDRLDVRDDALLYAGKGVNLNQAPEFSLINDLNGNPVRDSIGRLQVRDQALVMGDGYSTFNIPNNSYGGINPAQTVAQRTVEVPAFADLKTLVLNQKTPISGAFTRYSAQTPLNSMTDWQASFPNGASATTPTLIRVVNGGLNIPDGVTLENAIVLVEQGDINFNGSGHRLKNVTIVAENGSVNLGNIQTQDVTILASRSIQMNSAARFAGKTLIANGDTNGITFNGATTSNSDTDALTVISQGRLTFNASADTRGAFFSRGDFSFNSAVELVGVIQTKGDLFFNASGSVRSFIPGETPIVDPIDNGPIDNGPIDNGPIVDPTPANRPPVITSTALTTATAGQRYTYDVDAIDPDNNSLLYSLFSAPTGMTIDQASGLITWNPATQPTGNYAVTVNVSDGLGGIASQAFAIGLTNNPVLAPTGEIKGLVWNDLNGNGIKDSQLIQGTNPDIVFVIDVSGSSLDPFNGSPVGDLNQDSRSNTILDAEIAAFQVLNKQLIQQGLGQSARVSIVKFSSFGLAVDMNPALSGRQIFTTPVADNDTNGELDASQSAASLQVGASTLFENALNSAIDVFKDLKTTPGNGNLIFLSDGADQSWFTGSFDDEVAELKTLGINLSALGVGADASLTDLSIIDPKAKIFTSTDDLLNVFGGLNGGQSIAEPGQANVKVYLDLNNNGLFDSNEPTQLTLSDNPNTAINEAGQYRFTNLAAGTYNVRTVVPTGSTQTFPGLKVHQVNLGTDAIVDNLNFGLTIV